MFRHIEDYTTANLDNWDLPFGDVITNKIKERQPKQSRTGYVNREATKHLFVDDLDHPYNEDKPFDWIEVIMLGGGQLRGEGKVIDLPHLILRNARKELLLIGQLDIRI